MLSVRRRVPKPYAALGNTRHTLDRNSIRRKLWRLRRSNADTLGTLGFTYSLHCSSFFGLTNFMVRILYSRIWLTKKRNCNADYR